MLQNIVKEQTNMYFFKNPNITREKSNSRAKINLANNSFKPQADILLPGLALIQNSPPVHYHTPCHPDVHIWKA